MAMPTEDPIPASFVPVTLRGRLGLTAAGNIGLSFDGPSGEVIRVKLSAFKALQLVAEIAHALGADSSALESSSSTHST